MSSARSWSLAYVIPTILVLLFVSIQAIIVAMDYHTSRERLILTSKQDVSGKVNKLQQSLSDALMRHDNAVAERELTLAALDPNVSMLLAMDENAEVILANRMNLKYMFARSVFDEFTWDDFHQASQQNHFIYAYSDAEQMIRIYAPLQLARKDHSLKRNNTGAIFIAYSLEAPLNALLVTSIQDSVKSTFIVAFAMAMLILLLLRLIINPLNALVRDVNKSDMSVLADKKPSGQGEIGMLQGAFYNLADTMRQNFERLKASEQRWHYALSGARDGVWDWDLETGEAFFSPRWKEMLGFAESEISSDIEELEKRIHPDDLYDAFAALRRHFSGQTPFYEHIHRVRSKDGGYRWILDRGKVIDWNEQGLPARLICTHTDITEYKEAQELVAWQAYHDEVTQLPNRRKLLDTLSTEVARASQDRQYGGLVFVDLDRFKQINDVQGHTAGDELLRMVARRLQQTLNTADFLARLSGDEFAIVLPQLSEDKDRAASMAKEFCETVRQRIASPFVLNGQRVNLDCTIGITLFPGDENVATDLLRQADIAMFHGKHDGREHTHFFSEEMESRVQHNHNLQQMLRLALEQDEMKLFLQPKVDINGNMVGCEALMRWYQPQKGWISPAEFIPAAEDSGIILPLGSWVIRKSCELLKRWQGLGLPEGFTTISVNVSPKQFQQAGFVSEIKQLISEFNINPALLELEITERVLVSQLDQAADKIRQLRELGIRFAIDDFGTGYSSMSYLSRLPITALKIDRTFISSIETEKSQQAIVSAIIAMAENLNLDVVAEGVENQSQLNFLRERGCHLYQGFLFGKALSTDDFSLALFRQNHTSLSET